MMIIQRNGTYGNHGNEWDISFLPPISPIHPIKRICCAV